MPQKLTDKHKILLFTSLCCLVYFTSYLTRLNYTAALSEICDALHIDRQAASLPITGCFIIYGIGQFICGILGDKISPRNMIFGGLLLSSVCNVSVALTSSIAVLTGLWCVNGFAQSMIWPPLVRIMASSLHDKAYQTCCIAVAGASSSGTILVYFLVPICVSVFEWRTVFIFSAAFGFIVCILWFIFITRLCGPLLTAKAPVLQTEAAGTTDAKAAEAAPMTFKFIAVQTPFLFMLATGVFHGIIRDGITTWMPVYIGENFGLSNSLSILTTAILPAFSIISVALASKLLEKLKNEMLSATVLFSCALTACLVLLPFQATSAPVSITMMTLITGCMHGINLFIISHAPRRFEKYGKVAAVSGILNAATYIGSALSTYVIAGVSEKFGWYTTILCWTLLAVAGLLVCILSIKKWSQFLQEKKHPALKKHAAA